MRPGWRHRRGARAGATTAAVLLAALLAPLTSGALAAAPSWRLEQPAPPAGVPWKVPLGAPGDLQFWSPTRGLLALEGNGVAPRGLLLWNGQRWRTLSTVCGGSADTLRVAWVGPTEWWTVSEPSRPRVGSGTTLCHYVGGAVVGSYGTLPQSADPYRLMNAATCRSATDCWFGGPADRDPAGSRSGAFRLRWNGNNLATSYGPQGRGISDLEVHGGDVVQTSLVGPRAGDRSLALNRVPEDAPKLVSRIDANGVVRTDSFIPQPIDGLPADGTELTAADSDGTQLWVGGGGASSGPSAPESGAVDRPPLLARQAPGASALTEVTPRLTGPVTTFGTAEQVMDIAAIPGTGDAMAALAPYAERRSVNVKARVARVNAVSGETEITTLPSSGSGRGAAAKVACPSATQCWMVTRAGWVFHWTDGAELPTDEDPAFASVISDRPNESAAQFVPDTPPVDDSLLLAPPPVEEIAPPEEQTVTKRLPALMKRVKGKLNGLTLVISFQLTRKAKIGVTARRKGKRVARTKQRWIKPGKRRTIKLRLRRDKWPTKLAFDVNDPAVVDSGGGDDDEAVSTALRQALASGPRARRRAVRLSAARVGVDAARPVAAR